MGRRLTILVLILTVLVCIPFHAETLQAEEISDLYSIKLTDADGHDLSDPLFGGEVTIYFDTYDTSNGIVYKLKAMLSIRTIPANLVIKASGGQFKVAVSASGMDSFLAETGMCISITNGSDVYVANLKNANNFSDEFRNAENASTISFFNNPNTPN